MIWLQILKINNKIDDVYMEQESNKKITFVNI